MGTVLARPCGMLTVALFWVSAAIPLYAYLGYPVVLVLLGLVIRRPVRRGPAEPMVSLLVPAYNEERVIAAKIRNALALDYPPDRLEVVIACDGSRDRTVEVARELADGVRVRVVHYQANRGKIVVMNDAIPELRGDIVVLSDASSMLQPDAVRQLVSNFTDPEVGAVSGKYTVVRPDDVASGRSEDFYWRYETFLKARESALGSTVGAHGQINAIRRDLYPFPPAGTINDDYIIPLSVVSRGYRAVYDPLAVSCEPAHEMTGFSRRVRIARGNLQQLREIGALLRPPRLLPLFFFVSHKVLRLLVPFAMVAALVTNALLLGTAFYRVTFAVQAAFYLLAAVGTGRRLRPRVLAIPSYFTMINAAVFVALLQAMLGRRTAWK